MSYMVLSLVLSFVVGVLGMFFFVMLNAPAEKASRVVWGSLAFWLCVALVAYLTVGWPSAMVSSISGLASLLLLGKLGDVFFTWGRALVESSNAVPYLPTNLPFRWLGVRMKNMQVPLNTMFRRH